MTGRTTLLLTMGFLGLACEAPRGLNEACSSEVACSDGLTCCSDFRCQAGCARRDAGAPGTGDAGSTTDGGVSPDAGQHDAGAPSDGGAPNSDGGVRSCPFSDGGLAGASCTDLEELYRAAFAVALRCNPSSLVEPCTEKRSAHVDCCADRFINAGSGAELDLLTCLHALRPDAGRLGCLIAPCPGCGRSPLAGRCTPVPDGGPNEGLCETLY